MTYVYKNNTQFDEGFKFSFKVQKGTITLGFTIFMLTFPHLIKIYHTVHVTLRGIHIRSVFYCFHSKLEICNLQSKTTWRSDNKHMEGCEIVGVSSAFGIGSVLTSPYQDNGASRIIYLL